MLAVDRAGVRFGPVAVLDGVSLEVPAGRIVGLVGPNGAGKTTLLDAAGGLVRLATGAVHLDGTDITRLPPHRRARLGLARTFQGLDLFDDLSATENVLVTAGHRIGGQRLQEPLVRALSHGERKAVALERALASPPKVLLLDEPAAGLDPAPRTQLGGRLRALADGGMAILLADHDLDLVMDLCDDVCVLDFGRVIAYGPPAEVRRDPAVLQAYLGAGSTPSAVRASAPGEVRLEARGLVAGYGGGPAVDGLDLTVHAGEVVALLGPNGAGKTTTLRALSGLLRPTAGEATVLGGPAAARPEKLARRGLAHVPQDRAVLPSLTVAENLRLATRRSTALEQFPSLVALRDRRAGRLSGGEQQLLALARALARSPQVLLVDELSLGLAPRTARQALDAVRARADAGVACLLAEQHPVLALEVADRAVVLVAGRCVFDGPAADLVARPEVLRDAYLGRA